MRAKKIHENINFERGKNPKSSMELGHKNLINFLSLLKQEEIGSDVHVRIVDLNGVWFLIFDHYDFYKIHKHIMDKYTSSMGKYFMDVDSYDKNHQSHIKLAIRPDKVDLVKNIWDNISDNIYEGHNFERGRDVKSSMSIGKASQRNFEDEDQMIKWILWFPSVVTEGVLDKWNPSDMISTIETHKDFHEKSPFTKLDLIRFIKNSLYINGEGLGLRDSKEIADITTKLIAKGEVPMRKVNENFGFEREENPLKKMRLGKYRSQPITFKDMEGSNVTIEVIDNEFNINDLHVRLGFYEMDELLDEAANVYVDGQKTDIRAYRIVPANYEFKEQGKYSEEGYTSYGFPIAKDDDHLEELRDKYAYWHVQNGDYSRTDRNPFIAVAKMILLTF
jgi:hypothetical protein